MRSRSYAFAVLSTLLLPQSTAVAEVDLHSLFGKWALNGVSLEFRQDSEVIVSNQGVAKYYPSTDSADLRIVSPQFDCTYKLNIYSNSFDIHAVTVNGACPTSGVYNKVVQKTITTTPNVTIASELERLRLSNVSVGWRWVSDDGEAGSLSTFPNKETQFISGSFVRYQYQAPLSTEGSRVTVDYFVDEDNITDALKIERDSFSKFNLKNYFSILTSTLKINANFYTHSLDGEKEVKCLEGPEFYVEGPTYHKWRQYTVYTKEYYEESLPIVYMNISMKYKHLIRHETVESEMLSGCDTPSPFTMGGVHSRNSWEGGEQIWIYGKK